MTLSSDLTYWLSRDRFITTVNVLGDGMGAGIVQHLSGDALIPQTDDPVTWSETRKTGTGDLVPYCTNV